MNEQEQQIQQYVNQLNSTIQQLDQDNANLISMLPQSKQTITYYRSQIEQLSKRNAELEKIQNEPELTPVEE